MTSSSIQLGINANFINVSCSGQVRMSASDTSNAPGYTWTGDTDTGIWHPSGDSIGLSTGGINRLFINSNIGINTQTPIFPLDVNGAIRTTSNFFCGTTGSSNTPCYSWAHDSNTGMFNHALDVIGFATNGVTRVTIDSNINTSGNIIPTANEVYDIGTSNLRFRDLYLSGNTINLGSNISIKADSSIQDCISFTNQTGSNLRVIAREVVIAGSNNVQKVMRVDGAGALKFFNRTGAQGVETEEIVVSAIKVFTFTSSTTGTAGGLRNLLLTGIMHKDILSITAAIFSDKGVANGGLFIENFTNYYTQTGSGVSTGTPTIVIVTPSGNSLYLNAQLTFVIHTK